MIIENKKTHLQYHITEDEWALMKQNGLQIKFKVISKATEYAEKKNSLPPPEVREFIATQKKLTKKPKKQQHDN